jgi:hypothetical protein
VSGGKGRSVPLKRTLIVGFATLLVSCVQGQAFRVDDRVSITAPRDRAVVDLPVTLTWRAQEIDEPRFAVFVDRAPVRPGQRVDRVGDEGVFTTSQTELVIRELDEGQGSGRERHTATIVLLDSSGRRIGESAWDVVFEVKREARQ